MLPLDLPWTTFSPPPGDRRSAAIVTGGLALHHVHLASVINHEHPGLVRAWFALSDAPPEQLPRPLDGEGSGEAAIFEEELRHLASQGGLLSPERIPRSDMGRVLPTRLKEIDPYFLLILGGPLLSTEVLRSARGVAINAHAGWSPELKGSATIEQALYYRRTDWLGNTVHLASSNADGGPILRRTTVTAYADDRPTDLFYRSVALGNWLMAEVVSELLTAQAIRIFPQPDRGSTMRLSDWDDARAELVAGDLRQGWLRYALGKERSY